MQDELLTTGMAASPGAAVGDPVFDNTQAVERSEAAAAVMAGEDATA